MSVSPTLAARFILVLELAALTAAGCSSHAAKRYIYDLGNQHRCAEGTEHRPYGSAEWLRCTQPAATDSQSFENYEKAIADPKAARTD